MYFQLQGSKMIIETIIKMEDRQIRKQKASYDRLLGRLFLHIAPLHQPR